MATVGTKLARPISALSRGALLVFAVLGTNACGGSDAPLTPPDPVGPILTCPTSITTNSVSASGVVVPYTRPTPVGGRAPVSVTCAPASGQVFPIGSTTVTCTATDAAALSASCSFQVTVTPTLRLTRGKFLAFGDSITAGEVTVPVTTMGALGRSQTTYPLVLVPSAAYPTVLNDKLSQRYASQTITVENAGKPGEATAVAGPRFQATMNASQPEVVLLLMGYNDLGTKTSVSTAIGVIQQMVLEARGRGARVFLATLTPGIPGRQRSQPEQNLLAYNDSIRALAASSGVVLVDLYQAGLPNVNAWIGVDGLHPTEVGYAGMAEVFFQAVKADLEVR